MTAGETGAVARARSPWKARPGVQRGASSLRPRVPAARSLAGGGRMVGRGGQKVNPVFLSPAFSGNWPVGSPTLFS